MGQDISGVNVNGDVGFVANNITKWKYHRKDNGEYRAGTLVLHFIGEETAIYTGEPAQNILHFLNYMSTDLQGWVQVMVKEERK